MTEKLAHVPVIEYPVTTVTSKPLVVIYSGDGGWAKIDRYLASRFQAQGMPVVGINCLKYLWRKKTVATCKADLEHIIQHYQSQWHRQSVILSGFSRGACILPIIIDALAPIYRQKIELVLLMSVFPFIKFEFHCLDWIYHIDRKGSISVEEALYRIKALNILCLFGEKEKKTLCWSLPREVFHTVKLPGGHHYNHQYHLLYDEIEKYIKQNK